MKTNVIDFIRASAEVLADERPDIYDLEGAVEEMSENIDNLRELGLPFACISFTSFMITRTYEDDLEEFILARKITGMLHETDTGDTRAYGYIPDVNLPYIMDSLLDDLDEDDEG